jgi:pectin methylesterase-like acyl-CoA thioesterase/pectate lyase
MQRSKHCLAACIAALGFSATSETSARSKPPAPLTAFPGAEGAGRLSLGGRAGRVLKVTNLDDAGPGSLRAAVEATGPRTVVFDVSGTIVLAKPLAIREPRITIAGQSAPGDGITLRNQPLIVEAGDVVIRYIRSRLGDEGHAESDAIWVHSGRRIILDHVSASWSVDETLSVNNAFRKPEDGFYDVTVQWSFITESLNKSLHVKGPHGYGSLIAGGFGTRISFHHNLWAHHSGRNPRPGNPAQPERDTVGAFHDYRSNVFYDWGGEHAGYNADTGIPKRSIVKYNFVDNTYLPGPASTGRIAFNESNELAQAYFAGNTMNGELPADPWSLTNGKNGASWRLAQPVDVALVAPEAAPSAFERVLASAGASLVRDAVDQRVVASVRDRSGGLIDSQKEVGDWPELKSLPPFIDGDNDAMPDHWERAHSLNLAADDSASDADGNGYTNLEDYLNDLLAPRSVPRITANGTNYPTLRAAVDALPATGGEILLAPGEYREKVTIDKPGVTLRGTGARAQDVVLVWGDSALTAGGTVKSASLTVTGDDFRATNLTIQNDYELRVVQHSQAVALAVTGDRALFERVRLLGAQDTLYAATKKCAAEPCATSRQIFRDCYIEGHVDFIFGDSKAYFDRCHIHAIAHPEIMITAHARTAPDQDRAYVFDRCRITGDPGAESIYFGRPWRDYARVIFLDTQLDAAIHPEGWREWTPGKTDRLKLAYYAEHGSKGTNSRQETRETHAIRLTAAEAHQWRKWGHSLFPSKRGRT